MQLNGTKVFTIAVGEAATTKVQALASRPLSKYYYNVKNEQFLPKILHKMILNMCHRDDDAVDAERAAAEPQHGEECVHRTLLLTLTS